ncbi:MAG: hypothetical protein ACJATU_000844 [Rickettsiales bacterium]|jgi:hypothetical protein
MQNKILLFIVEKNILDGKSYFGSSNDLLLISSALRMNYEVYLTIPEEVFLNHERISDFPVLRLLKNVDETDEEIRKYWKKEVVNCLLALGSSPSPHESQSKILFVDAKTTNINLNEIVIFNRTEPISLTNKFYDLLISWKNIGIRISPDPYLNQILGDKLSINAVHDNFPIAKIDLLEDINFEQGENEISFKTKIISLSNNHLNGEEVSEFYDLLIDKNFEKAEKNFPDEYQIFIQGADKYLEFHRELGNDSILKPTDYFGGTGIVVAKNQNLDLDQAIINISKSFLAIKEDSGNANIAFLPSIIVQERANMAHLGDLRIVFCKGNLQGIFVRFNTEFDKSKASNLHFGGHAKSLFRHYEISNEGVDRMIIDMKLSDPSADNEEIQKAHALYGLIEKINFLKQIKIFKQYSIIGADALLSRDQEGKYEYRINEINLTSPMGQVQLLLLQMAVKFSNLATNILQKNGLGIEFRKYQILADFFKNQNEELTLKARDILLSDQNFQEIIGEEIQEILENNFASETLDTITKCTNH